MEDCGGDASSVSARGTLRVDSSRSAAYRLLAATLILRPFGNLCLAWGTRHFSQVLAVNPVVYLSAMLNPYIAAGIAMLILVTLMRMALFSLADLSFIVPLTATGYIISTFLGKFFLSEQVTWSRWLGTLLIFAGTVVVSSTSRKTAPQSKGNNEFRVGIPPLPENS